MPACRAIGLHRPPVGTFVPGTLERRLRSRRKSKLRWWRPQIGRKHCRIDGGEKRIPLGRFAAKGHESFRRGDKVARSQRNIIFHAQRSQAKRIFTVTGAICHCSLR